MTQKNKFVLWGRDDVFDRFLEQKIKEELAILAGVIPANFIRLCNIHGDVSNLVTWRGPSYWGMDREAWTPVPMGMLTWFAHSAPWR